jgi:tetratricopeptide (TPR) repeat protein
MSSRLPPEIVEKMQAGTEAAKRGDYQKAIENLSHVYSTGFVEGTVDALSFYALSLSMSAGRHKEAIDLCQQAIRVQFLNPYHYVNLARIYHASGNPKRAIKTLQQGLAALPNNRLIVSYWKEIGLRAAPPISFLSRENPLNKILGKARHASKKKKGG